MRQLRLLTDRPPVLADAGLLVLRLGLSTAFIVAMAGALIYLHRGEPLAIQPDGSGFGFAFIMGAASLALLLLGPGRVSADHLLVSRRGRSGRSLGAEGSAPSRHRPAPELRAR